MNLFRKLFGKTTPVPAPAKPASALRFHEELLATVPRYLCKPAVPVNLKLTNPDTGEPMLFSDLYPQKAATWESIQSVADRRSVIYSALDELIGSKLELWQLIERFTDDRYPEKALNMAQQEHTPEDLQTADYWAAVAKTNFVLTNYTEAAANALKALELTPGHKRAGIVLADTYHFTDQQEKAHEIYDEILATKLPKDTPMELSIHELLGFDGDILPSPVYAAAWLKADANVTEETWDWAGQEFYYSPQFRCQHAYYLIEKKEHLKGFVKLYTLAKDMPWCKEAVVNSYSLIDQLGMGDKCVAEKALLKNIMEENGY